MFNFYETKVTFPERYRMLKCGEALITLYNCPLENKLADLWSQHNYIVYVVEGRKIWHTADGSYKLEKGSCAFVRKGAVVVEQFFDASFCLVLFFVPDDFIISTLRSKSTPLVRSDEKYDRVISVASNERLDLFFHSMSSYFAGPNEPDQSLLELKFRELILTIADNPKNAGLLSYFGALLLEPQAVSLQRVMDDNYCFNLKLEDFAQLCNRSLSAFKRDFQKQYQTTPGKWLLEKRLAYALHLLTNLDKTVGEAAFESGFENASHFSRAFKERFGSSPAAAKASSQRLVKSP